MSSTGGGPVCQWIQDELGTHHVPIILILPPGVRDDEFGSKARGLAHDYVTKPFDIDELRLRVQGAIARARRELQNLDETRST
jgi:DNA-binding response OmpR family regulator